VLSWNVRLRNQTVDETDRTLPWPVLPRGSFASIPAHLPIGPPLPASSRPGVTGRLRLDRAPRAFGNIAQPRPSIHLPAAAFPPPIRPPIAFRPPSAGPIVSMRRRLRHLAAIMLDAPLIEFVS
jgi:hypothetical protein